jgi:hypothetical protein
MEWTFTAEEVVKGEVDYTIEEFRRDLYEEVRSNFPEYSKSEMDTMFSIAYDVCYCIATSKELDDLLKHLQDKGIKADKNYLELIRDSNLANIDMLKALFARKVADFMDEGCSSEEALKTLDEYHKNLVSNPSSFG